jgi:hypothetical protein
MNLLETLLSLALKHPKELAGAIKRDHGTWSDNRLGRQSESIHPQGQDVAKGDYSPTFYYRSSGATKPWGDPLFDDSDRWLFNRYTSQWPYWDDEISQRLLGKLGTGEKYPGKKK